MLYYGYQIRKTMTKFNPNRETLKKIAQAIAAAIVAFLTAIGLCSCGVTRATITKPAAGTTTTVTITTNNPMTTQVNPTTNAEVLNK